MKYREIADTEGIFVAMDTGCLRTDFDSGVTKATLELFKGEPKNQDSIYEINVELTTEFIEDTYRLSGEISDSAKVKALLDVGERIYREKGGVLVDFELIRGLRANQPLRYIPRINMQPTDA